MKTPLKGMCSCFLFVVTTIVVYNLSLPIFLENFDAEGSMPSDDRMEPKWSRSYSGRHLICHHFFGDIGDQLFQYASLLALAQPQERILVSTQEDSMLENFLVDFNVRPGAAHCEKVEKITEKFCCRDYDRFMNLDRHKNYDLEGALRTWFYFKDKEQLINDSIKFQKPILQQAERILKSVLRNVTTKDTVLVGVHVRRGDRSGESKRIDGYRVAPKEYFQNAMDKFRHRFKSVLFLVISKDYPWCKDNILGVKDILYLPSQRPEIDLAMFTFMDHSIISVGSFSWWAGHFTKGDVVYYMHPVEPDSKLMTEYGGTMDKTFKSKWLPMK